MRPVVFLLLACALPLGVAAQTKLAYPPAERSDHTDVYFGTRVADPYRWMEDIDSPATQAWIGAERALTASVLDQLPAREAMRTRMKELWNYPRFGLPQKKGSRYFFLKNDGLQNQSVLYVQESAGAPPRVLVDPNTLAADGTVALAGIHPSPDGKLLAYGLAAAGSDWKEFYVRDVATGKDTTDHLKWIQAGSVAWTHDNAGFFYSRFPAQAEGKQLFSSRENEKVFYHRLGAPQTSDRMIFERPDHPLWRLDADVSDDGQWLNLLVFDGTRRENLVYVQALGDADHPALKGERLQLVDTFEASFTPLGNRGTVYYFLTTLKAPNQRVIAIDLLQPTRDKWREVIPEGRDVVESANYVGGHLVLGYLHDAQSRLQVFSYRGERERDIPLPGVVAVGATRGRADEPELFYSYESYLQPTTVMRYNVETGASDPLQAPKFAGFAADQYETQQVFFKSKDGTRIPMFITAKRGLAHHGDAPVLLYGYGGFNITHRPEFAVPTLIWLEQGGVYADVCLRGGGEYGEDWHHAGTKEHKQNVFDDYIAAAEWLVSQHYTRPDRLAIYGRSNGGLLVGAVLNQRPDLCGVALPTVGVMDMLRFHKFTVGAGWISDYGSSDDAAGFKYLYAYSPLHTVKAGAKYPATLITTGDHDDRVFPAHSFKYAAAMQAATSGTAPVIIRIDSKAGHGGASGTAPVSKQIDEWADRLAFAWHYLKMD